MAEPAHQEYSKNESPDATDIGTRQRAEGARIYGLVRHLIDDVAVLVRKEVALAGSELSHAFRDTKQGLSGMISGTVFLNSGLIMLLISATLGLSQVLPGWAAALIVGGVTTLIGLIMMVTGRKKFETTAFTPTHTMDEVRKDRNMVRRSTS